MISIEYNKKVINVAAICNVRAGGVKIHQLTSLAAKKFRIKEDVEDLCIKFRNTSCIINMYDDLYKVILHHNKKNIHFVLTYKKSIIYDNLVKNRIPVNVVSYITHKESAYALLHLGVGYQRLPQYSNSINNNNIHPKLPKSIGDIMSLHRRNVEGKRVNNHGWIIGNVSESICISLCDILYKMSDKSYFISMMYSNNFSAWYNSQKEKVKDDVKQLFTENSWVLSGKWKVEKKCEMISNRYIPQKNIDFLIEDYVRYSIPEKITDNIIPKLYSSSEFYSLYRLGVTREILEDILLKDDYPYPLIIFKMVVKDDITVDKHKYLESLLINLHFDEFLNITKLPQFNFIEGFDQVTQIMSRIFKRYIIKSPLNYRKVYWFMQRIKEDAGYDEANEALNEHILREILTYSRKRWQLHIGLNVFGSMSLYLKVQDSYKPKFLKRSQVLRELKYIGDGFINPVFRDRKITIHEPNYINAYKKRIVNASGLVYFLNCEMIYTKRNISEQFMYHEALEFFPYYKSIYNAEKLANIDKIKQSKTYSNKAFTIHSESDPYKITMETLEHIELKNKVRIYMSKTL